MTTVDEGLPPELPPPLPPRLPSTSPKMRSKPGSGCRKTAIVAAAVAVPVSAALGVAAVFGATQAANYLTVDGLLGSLFGLSVSLWPIGVALLAADENGNASQRSGKVVTSLGGVIVLLPAMAIVRAFISAHLNRTPPVWYGEYAGLMHAAEVVAACVWGLFGMLITYSLVAGKTAKPSSGSG